MSAWTRLVRFIAQDGQIRLGQPIDASLDVGLAIASAKTVEVNLIHGDVFTGTVSSDKATIRSVSKSLGVGLFSRLILCIDVIVPASPPGDA